MSHHRTIIINGKEYGHVRITNSGQILSIWIVQPWGEGELLTSKYEEVKEEEFVQTGNGTVAQRLRDLEEEE